VRGWWGAVPATVEPAPIEPRVEVRLDVPGEPDWMAAGAGSVWVKTADGYVQCIDPATNQVAANIEVPPYGRLPPATGWARAWVLTGDGSTLVGIAEDAVVTEIDLGTRCTELTASGTAIWAACPMGRLPEGCCPYGPGDR
jgi:hypothetical protein